MNRVWSSWSMSGNAPNVNWRSRVSKCGHFWNRHQWILMLNWTISLIKKRRKPRICTYSWISCRGLKSWSIWIRLRNAMRLRVRLLSTWPMGRWRRDSEGGRQPMNRKMRLMRRLRWSWQARPSHPRTRPLAKPCQKAVCSRSASKYQPRKSYRSRTASQLSVTACRVKQPSWRLRSQGRSTSW